MCPGECRVPGLPNKAFSEPKVNHHTKRSVHRLPALAVVDRLTVFYLSRKDKMSSSYIHFFCF